jgi:5-methylcytosine-specific restriction endonuclease McrA
MSRFKGLGNDQLLIGLKALVKSDRILEAELISHLGEVEARCLHLEQGCSSMFDYCVRVLCFAEGVAYKRIGVARAARKFLGLGLGLAISRGELHLSGASLIAPHLSEESVAEWLKTARRKTTREIKQLIADRFPREGVRSSVRRLSSGSQNADSVHRNASPQPDLRTVGLSPSNSPRPSIMGSQRNASGASSVSSSSTVAGAAASPEISVSTAPIESRDPGSTEALGAERYVVRFTADERVHAQLQELRSLLRHSIPDGDVGKILERAIGALLEQVRKQKIGACDSPRSVENSSERSSRVKTPAKRNSPVAIRRAVWARDDGRCTYRSKDGRSCGSREAVEFHHRVPWARCREHTIDNISLRCRAHNQYEARLDFGEAHMARFRRDALGLYSRRAADPREIGR